MTTITIYNSKNKLQKQYTKETEKLALIVLDRINGKNGWWAKVEDAKGNYDIFNFIAGVWMN